MDRPSTRSNIRELLDEHERSLVLEIDELRVQGGLIRTRLAQKEIELIEVRHAKASVDDVRTKIVDMNASSCVRDLAMAALVKVVEGQAWPDDDSG